MFHSGRYNKDGRSFSLIAYDLADLSFNFGNAMMRNFVHHPITTETIQRMLDAVENLFLLCNEFETREGFSIPIEGTDDIKRGLQKKDPVDLLMGACRLSASMKAADDLNHMLSNQQL